MVLIYFMACDMLAYFKTRSKRRTGGTQYPRMMKRERIRHEKLKIEFNVIVTSTTDSNSK